MQAVLPKFLLSAALFNTMCHVPVQNMLMQCSTKKILENNFVQHLEQTYFRCKSHCDLKQPRPTSMMVASSMGAFNMGAFNMATAKMAATNMATANVAASNVATVFAFKFATYIISIIIMNLLFYWKTNPNKNVATSYQHHINISTILVPVRTIPTMSIEFFITAGYDNYSFIVPQNLLYLQPVQTFYFSVD